MKNKFQKEIKKKLIKRYVFSVDIIYKKKILGKSANYNYKIKL